jgi:hypothetical protein
MVWRTEHVNSIRAKRGQPIGSIYVRENVLASRESKPTGRARLLPSRRCATTH